MAGRFRDIDIGGEGEKASIVCKCSGADMATTAVAVTARKCDRLPMAMVDYFLLYRYSV